MPKRLGSIPAACLVVAATVGVDAQRGQPPRPDNPASLAHLKAAQSLAGDDAFLAIPYNFFCVAGNARAQNNNAPDLEPTRLFDNVYAVGNSETTVYALTSSDGIVLLDAGFENKAEALAAQLKTLNLDPARVKYILLGHGHADHFGGAKFFQDTYGTKIAASAADWDLIGPRAAGGRRGGGGGASRQGRRAHCRPALSVRRSLDHAGGHSRAYTRLARVHLSGEGQGHDSHGRTVRRNGADDRHPDDRRVEAVHAVDCAATSRRQSG